MSKNPFWAFEYVKDLTRDQLAEVIRSFGPLDRSSYQFVADIEAAWLSHQSVREARNADALAAELTERAAMWGMV